MGEEETKTEKENKNEGEKTASASAAAADGGGKKDDGLITVVLKLNLHCEGCAKKVKRSVRHFEGVENVKADWGSNSLTVIGKVDPASLRERVEYKTKKKVELVSPHPKKDAGTKKSDENSDKKIEEKSDKKPEEKKEDDEKHKKPTPSSVVMQIKLHCDGCAHKIKRIINKNIDGVDSVSTNLEKNLVMVNGTMDIKHLTTFLKEKLNRSVDIVPPKKDESGGDKKGKDGGGEKKDDGKGDGGAGGAGGEKKDDGKGDGGAGGAGGEKKDDGKGDGGAGGAGGEKKDDGKGDGGAGGAGGEKKDDGKGDGGGGASGEKKEDGGEGSKIEGTKVEINKVEHQTFNTNTHYADPMNQQTYVHHDYVPMYNQGYANTMVQYSHGPPPPPPTYVNDQMFSDENASGCFIM